MPHAIKFSGHINPVQENLRLFEQIDIKLRDIAAGRQTPRAAAMLQLR